jgi:hypothetical protein
LTDQSDGNKIGETDATALAQALKVNVHHTLEPNIGATKKLAYPAGQCSTGPSGGHNTHAAALCPRNKLSHDRSNGNTTMANRLNRHGDNTMRLSTRDLVPQKKDYDDGATAVAQALQVNKS